MGRRCGLVAALAQPLVTPVPSAPPPVDPARLEKHVKKLSVDLYPRSFEQFSDHRSYWAEGYPALMVTATAFMRNPQYHKAGDTFDKLDYPRMAKVVQSVYAVTQQY